MRRTSRALMLMLAGLVACDNGPTQPTTNSVSFSHSGISPITPTAEEAWVCKEGPAGNYTFTATGNFNLVSSPFTVAAGSCVRITLIGGLSANVTVTETGGPAATTLDHIEVFQFRREATPQVLFTSVAGPSATGLVGGNTTGVPDGNERGVVFVFYNRPVVAAGAVLLIIDEDGIDNGLHVNKYGGFITPAGPQFFKPGDVNENAASLTQRGVLPYFAANIGRTITVVTGRTDDEGWFAPNCIPKKLLPAFDKENNTCLTNAAARDLAIDNLFGLNGPGAIPLEERLDKIPHLIPLRSLGIVSLINKNVCALVYDGDVPTNYDHDKPEGVNGSFKGNVLGIVAFRVNSVAQLDGFSSSTLPQVNITILNTNVCGTWELFRAPVPESSSIPNDRLVPPSTAGYRSFTLPPVFF